MELGAAAVENIIMYYALQNKHILFFFFFNELYLSLQNPVSIQNMLVIFQNNFPGSSTPFGMDQGEAETHEYKTMGQVMVGSTAAPPPPAPTPGW